MHLGLTGPCVCNANGCAAGAVALGEAFTAIRSGVVDVALAGGAEAPLMPLTFGAFAAIRAMSTRNDDPAHASRPFDRDRDGFVMGEGAAMLVLEERESALRRGAVPLVELLGYGQTCDAYRMTAPLPDGTQAARAMRTALARRRTASRGHRLCQGTRQRHPTQRQHRDPGDPPGAGGTRERVPLSGTKGLHGHSLGASGAIEAAIVAMAMRNDYLPPTANLCHLDPDLRPGLHPG